LTPIHKLIRQKPVMDHPKVWGCEVYPNLKKKNHSKNLDTIFLWGTTNKTKPIGCSTLNKSSLKLARMLNLTSPDLEYGQT
jgi:hypothetical protein